MLIINNLNIFGDMQMYAILGGPLSVEYFLVGGGGGGGKSAIDYGGSGGGGGGLLTGTVSIAPYSTLAVIVGAGGSIHLEVVLVHQDIPISGNLAAKLAAVVVAPA